MNNTHAQHPSCEFSKVADMPCSLRAVVWLPLKLDNDNPQEVYGFCEWHAGAVAGGLAWMGELPEAQKHDFEK